MAILRSFVWLVGCSGLGILLFQFTTPNASYEKEIVTKYSGDRKKQQFLDVLKAAADSKEPLYKKSKQEIESITVSSRKE